MVQVLEDTTFPINQRVSSHLAPIAWYFGRAVYLELLWFRGEILNDYQLSERVTHLFSQQTEQNDQIDKHLPPKDHLINWALEIFEEDLMILANSSLLPQHPYVENDDFLQLMNQYQARLYEKMLEVALYQSAIQSYPDFIVQNPLVPEKPSSKNIEVSAGHYRIGPKSGIAFAEELPPQLIDLSRYRMTVNPVSNAQFLAFVIDEGYLNLDFWTEQGQQWLSQQTNHHPCHWGRDNNGRWFGKGIQGAFELIGDDPVSGICKYEAEAYIQWAIQQDKKMQGAVLPHEYQWEVAIKTQAIKYAGRGYEWCSNTFKAYDQYKAPKSFEMEHPLLNTDASILRGASIHTQPKLRRSSLRSSCDAGYQHPFAGMRIVLPPGEAFWEKN